jgi:hypothetical protein
LRLQRMDVPAIHLLIGNNDDAKHNSPTLKEAVEAYLLLKGAFLIQSPQEQQGGMAPKVRTVLAFNGLGMSKLQQVPTVGFHSENHQRSMRRRRPLWRRLG